jgi:hypothetical protein
VATNLLLLALAWRWFGPLAGALAGLLATLYAPLLYFELLLLRETCLVFTALALMFAFDVAARGAARRAGFAVGLALGIATLLKTLFLAFGVGAAVLLGLRWRARGQPAGIGLTFLALGVATALLPLLARNLAVGAPLLSIHSAAGPNLVLSNAYSPGAVVGGYRLRHMDDILGETGGAPLPTLVRTLGTYPSALAFLESVGGKLAASLHWYEEPDNSNFYLQRRYASVLRGLPIGFGLVGPLGLVGMVLAWRSRRGRGVAARSPGSPVADGVANLHWMVLVNLAVLVLFLVRDRFRLPLAAAMIPFAAYAAVELVRLAAARQWRVAVPAAAAVVVLGAWIARPLPEGKPLIRPIYYKALYTNYYEPRATAANAAGRAAEMPALLEDFLAHLPDDVRALGRDRPARSDADVDYARLLAGLHDAYALTLEASDRPAEAERARSRARELRALALVTGTP